MQSAEPECSWVTVTVLHLPRPPIDKKVYPLPYYSDKVWYGLVLNPPQRLAMPRNIRFRYGPYYYPVKFDISKVMGTSFGYESKIFSML